MNLLALAFYLSVLSYCIGVVLKGLPVPFLSLKRLGRSLVSDGVFSATLVFSYNLILLSLEYVGSVLGVNWVAFNSWLTERLLILTNFLAVLRALGIALERLGLGFVASNFLGPVTRLVVACYTSLLFILAISTIIMGGFKALFALGLALHAVPFRLTRSAGATILAFSMVFVVGVPLMPSFLSIVLTGVQPPLEYTEPVCTANITLVDVVDTRIGPAVIEGYDIQTGSKLYKYVVDEQGSLVVSERLGFPCRDHKIVVDIAGNQYIATFKHAGRHTSRTYRVTNSILLFPNRFLFIGPDVNVTSVARINKTVYAEVSLASSGNITVYVEEGDTLLVYLNGSNLDYVNRTQVEWNGVRYHAYSFTLGAGTHNLTIVLDLYKTTSPSILIDPFLLRVIRFDPFAPETLLFFAVFSFIDLVLLPMIYMVILALISMNVARLLGGYSSAIARFVVARV